MLEFKECGGEIALGSKSICDSESGGHMAWFGLECLAEELLGEVGLTAVAGNESQFAENIRVLGAEAGSKFKVSGCFGEAGGEAEDASSSEPDCRVLWLKLTSLIEVCESFFDACCASECHAAQVQCLGTVFVGFEDEGEIFDGLFG